MEWVEVRLGRYAWYVFCGLVFLFLVAPTMVVLPMSFSNVSYLRFPPPELSLRWWNTFFGDPRWLRVLAMSFKIALMTTAISLVLGTLAALALSKAKFRLSEVCSSILILPMIAPVIVIAVGTYLVFAPWGLIGKPFGIALAHSALALPYVFINVSASLQAFDDTLERAALISGANPWQTFLRVKLPLISPGIIAGILFAFVVSFDELVVTMFLCGAGARTLPVQLWDGIRTEITPIVAVASTLLIVGYFALFLIYEVSSRLIVRKG
jgi:putative spermidine/putrescine transport system permease protein